MFLVHIRLIPNEITIQKSIITNVAHTGNVNGKKNVRARVSNITRTQRIIFHVFALKSTK